MSILKRIGAAISVHRYPAILSVLICFVIAMMELRFPYFFLQDDNRVQHLPLYVHNIRAILSGEFPLYNFHQYLGMPVGIQNASLYPFNYVGLALSRLFLGHYLGAIDFIAFIHLIIAGLGFFYLMRSFHLEEPSCLFGAVAYTFCGYIITFGNSWIQTLDCAAYLPWILLYGIRLSSRGGYPTFLVLIGIRVLALLVGYPQVYVYIVTFEVMTVAALLVAARFPTENRDVLEKKVSGPIAGNILLYILSHAAALAIAMPVLLTAYYQASVSLTRKNVLDWKNYSSNSYDLKLWLNGLVAPLFEKGLSTWNELHFISHIGYLTLLSVLVALWATRRFTYRRQILILAGFALFSLMWSSDTVVTRLVYHLPVFNKFKHPFKLALFTSFYLIVIASFGFDLICRKASSLKLNGRSAARIVVPLLLVLHVLNFLCIHTFSRQYRFSDLLDAVPFDEPLKEPLSHGRIVSVLQKDINDNPLGRAVGPTVPLLGYDYATLWGLYHLGGHDSLVPEENFKAAFQLSYDSMIKVPNGSTMDELLKASIGYFRLWGVRWYVVDKAVPATDFGGLKLFHEDASRKIYYDSAALPFAFWSDFPEGAEINCELRTNSIVLHTQRQTDGMALVNVLWNPFFSAEVDGNRVTIAETNGKQLLIAVPGGNHVVVVKFSNPYFTAGLGISLITLAAILGYGWVWRRAEMKCFLSFHDTSKRSSDYA